MTKTEKSIGSKALAILLAISMALFLVPSAAWAEDTENGGSEEQETVKTTLADKLANIKDESTVTVDLGGETVYGGAIFTANATVTIQNGVIAELDDNENRFDIRSGNVTFGDNLVVNIATRMSNPATVTISKYATVNNWVCVYDDVYLERNDNGKIKQGSYTDASDIADKDPATLNIYGSVNNSINTNGVARTKPVVNIYEGAIISSNDIAIYAANIGELNVFGGTITGVDSAIGFKNGTLNITGGELICKGKNNTPTEGYSNGINASGCALQIEANDDYYTLGSDSSKVWEQNINITGGTFTSDQAYAIYEYIGKGSDSHLASLTISGGTFNGKLGTFLTSEDLAAKTGVIQVSGGTYSDKIDSAYLTEGYAVAQISNGYAVTTQAVADASNTAIDSSATVVENNGTAILSGSVADLVEGEQSLKVTSGSNTATLDTAALEAVIGETDDVTDTVAIEVEEVLPRTTDVSAVAGKGSAVATVSANLLVNGEATSVDFKTGKATITVPFAPEADATYSVYYVKDGKISGDAITPTVGKDSLTFTTTHFSDFVIVKNKVEEPADDTPASTTENVYRLYNKFSGEHLFTTSEYEYDVLVSYGWVGEKLGWVAPTSGTAVYRLYNPNSGDHLYTSDTNEYSELQKRGWKGEDVAFYSADTTGTKIYRLFNPNETIGTHHYTTSENEYKQLQTLGWKGEGVAMYSAE